jgi:hypothetical protein
MRNRDVVVYLGKWAVATNSKFWGCSIYKCRVQAHTCRDRTRTFSREITKYGSSLVAVFLGAISRERTWADKNIANNFVRTIDYKKRNIVRCHWREGNARGDWHEKLWCRIICASVFTHCCRNYLQYPNDRESRPCWCDIEGRALELGVAAQTETWNRLSMEFMKDGKATARHCQYHQTLWSISLRRIVFLTKFHSKNLRASSGSSLWSLDRLVVTVKVRTIVQTPCE